MTTLVITLYCRTDLVEEQINQLLFTYLTMTYINNNRQLTTCQFSRGTVDQPIWLRWSAELSTILKPTRNHFRIIESTVLLLFVNMFNLLEYNVYYKKQFRATVFMLWLPKWRPGSFFGREWGWRFLKSATPRRF